MSGNILSSLSMQKYERLLPRLFPDATRVEILDRDGDCFWERRAGEAVEAGAATSGAERDADYPWSDAAPGISRRKLKNGETQFRAEIASRGSGKAGWLLVAFNTDDAVPMAAAVEALRRPFSDALAFLQEELELQAECNQLAIELTERYEELNLVYSTKDQVKYFEEGHEALARLVQNCADYLDVGMSVLICRDRGLVLHHKGAEAPPNSEQLLELLGEDIYDRVESQVQGLVINQNDATDRKRLLGGEGRESTRLSGFRRSPKRHRCPDRYRKSRLAHVFQRRPKPARGHGQKGLAHHFHAP